jgi:2'-5' RNA ligase
MSSQNRIGQVVDVGDMMGLQRTGTPGIQDPAAQIPGMAPNFGQFVAPQIFSFQGLFSNVSNVYRANDEALRHSYDNARCMVNDPTIMECVEQRMRSTCLLDWHLEIDDPKDCKQRELADEMTRLIKSTPRFMQYRENLMRAIWYGRSANTHRWRWKMIHGRPRLIMDRWLPVHGDKLVFRYDKNTSEYNPDQVGIRVGGGFKLGEKVADRWKVEKVTDKIRPADFGLAYFLEEFERPLISIHRHMIEDGEYESPEYAGRVNGVGIRSRIYWTWYQKQEALAFLMEFLERSAFGIEMWYYPAGNASAKEQAKKAATERIGDGRNVILVPRPVGESSQDFGVDRIEPGMAGAQVLKEILVEYFGHQIKRYILGQTLTTEASATGLGSNVASIHLDTYLQIVRYDAINLDETLTTDFVEVLRNYNFPRCRDIPIRFKTDTEGEDVEKKLANYKMAFDMGLAVKSEEVANMIGAAMPAEGDDVLRSPAAQQPEGDNGEGSKTSVAMPDTEMARQLFAALERERDAKQLGDALKKPAGPEDSERERVEYAAGQQIELSSTQINLPESLADRVLAMAKKIDESDLHEYGREDEPHVTVKYGLHTKDHKDVMHVITGMPKIKIQLGKTSLFKCDKYDVVKIDVLKPQSGGDVLREMNRKISDSLDCTDTHPEYVPHVTLAYVKSGLGHKYAGMGDVEDEEFEANSLIFSPKNDTRSTITFAGKSVDYAAGRRSPSDRIKGGRADKLSERDFDSGELQRGARHEMEHTDDWRLAKEIAMDHLAEDPDYYRKLRRRMNDAPRNLVKRYANDSTAEHYKGKGERWIMIGAKSGPDGERRGGTPVKIDGRGRIVSGPKELTGKTVKALKQKPDKNERVEEAVAKAAKEHRVKKAELHDVVKDMWRDRRERILAREDLKRQAREAVGLTEKKLAKMENDGQDHTAVKHFDDIARSFAGENPELGFGTGYGSSDDNDYSRSLWDFIREERKYPQDRHDKELIDDAAEFIKSGRETPRRPQDIREAGEEYADEWGDSYEGELAGDDDPLPFAKAHHDQESIAVARVVMGDDLLPSASHYAAFADVWKWDVDGEHPLAVVASENIGKASGDRLAEVYSRLSDIHSRLVEFGVDDGAAETQRDMQLIQLELDYRMACAKT